MTTPILTQEERAALAPYETHLRTAVEQHYVRGISRIAYEKIYAIHKRLYPKSTPRLNTNCSICLYEMIRAVGRIYLAQESTKAAEVDNVTPAPKTPKKRTKKA